QPVDLDRPRAHHQGLGGTRDRLLRAEFVEIIVARRQFFVGQRTVEHITRVLLGRVEPGPGIPVGRRSEGRQQCGRKDRPRGDRLQQVPPPVKHGFRRRVAFAKLPSSPARDQHYRTSRSSGCRGRNSLGPCQVTVSRGSCRPVACYWAASALRMASTFSAGRPTSSCIWSKRWAKLPTPRVKDRNSTIRSCNSLCGIWALTTSH